MEQQKITRYFSREVKKECDVVNNIKEEINFDWNEKDNFYDLPTARVLIDRLDPKMVKSIIDKKTKDTKETTVNNEKAQSPAASVSKRPSNSKAKTNAIAKTRNGFVETIIDKQTKDTRVTTVNNKKSKLPTVVVSKRPSNSKAKTNATTKTRNGFVETIIDKKTKDTRETTVNNKKSKFPTVVVSKRPSNSKAKTNAIAKTRYGFVETSDETRDCPKCKIPYKIQTYDWHVHYCGRERKLQCDHCPYKTKYKKCLIAHIAKIHPEGGDARASRIINRIEIQRYCEKCERTYQAISITSCEMCYSKLMYKCAVCNKKMDGRGTANYHWATRCGVKGYYHCHSCDYKGVYRIGVVRHSRVMHPNSSGSVQWRSLFKDKASEVSSLFKCPKCAKHLENPRMLEAHVRLCMGEENEENVVIDDIISDPNKCSTCGKKFEHIYLLNKHVGSCRKNRHIIRIAKDSDEDIIEVVEDHPPVSLISADEIRKDIKQMAVEYCPKCEIESEIERTWWKNDVGQNVKCGKCKTAVVFRCKKCLREFFSKRYLLPHLKNICYPEDEFKCDKCNFKAPNVYRVRAHYKSMHQPVDTECKKCGKKFKNQMNLKAHLRNCGVKPKFQCDHCPFKSKLKQYLKNHILRTHMEPAVVGRRESLKMSWQRFARTLTHLRAFCSKCKEEKRLFDRLKVCAKCKTKLNFKCKTCKKKFIVDDENACDHVKAYLEKIKFECDRCGVGSISKTGLVMHKIRCGAEFPCRFCKYVSNVKFSTKKHEKTKHPDKV